MSSRRAFLKSSLLPLAFGWSRSVRSAPASGHSLVKPAALKPGDTIGLITPASMLFEGHRTIIEAREKISNLGFEVKPGKHILEKQGYLAGSIADRVSDIHDMFLDDAVKAIVAIRGGYGSSQLLPHINYEIIRHNPKILVGYSDITSLLVGIHQKTGLVTFHGPVATSTFTDYTLKYFIDVLGKTQPVGEIDDAPYEDNLQTSNRIWTVKPGTAEGFLMGGNLTLLQATLGTPYEFDSDGAILFIEEVGEEPYDLDRMLTHLKLAGKFKKCRGVVFDKLEKIKTASHNPSFSSSLSSEDVIENIFREYSFPVFVGMSLGHIKDKPTLPLGIRAGIDSDRGKLSLLEAAVC